jgi:HK97 family phage prohead protease
METVYKTFRAEIKEVEDDGSLNMFIPVSSGKSDRDGEVVEPSAFKKTLKEFMKHPVLVASHDYRDLTNQIGEWTKLKITENGIEGKPKYYVNAGNEQADWAYYLASNGKAAYSIGFIPKEWEDGDGVKSAKRTYKEIELLEISQVIVPSNRDAIMGMRSKSVDPVIKELLDEVEKSDLITKPEITENYIRIPVSEGHTEHKIRTINISTNEGIKALYCVDCKENVTYLFDKEKWTMTKAKKWVKEHEKKTAHDVSQSEIIDEIDYLETLLRESGASDEVKKNLQRIAESYLGVITTEVTIKETIEDVVQDTTNPVDNMESLKLLSEIIKEQFGG